MPKLLTILRSLNANNEAATKEALLDAMNDLWEMFTNPEFTLEVNEDIYKQALIDELYNTITKKDLCLLDILADSEDPSKDRATYLLRCAVVFYTARKLNYNPIDLRNYCNQLPGNEEMDQQLTEKSNTVYDILRKNKTDLIIPKNVTPNVIKEIDSETTKSNELLIQKKDPLEDLQEKPETVLTILTDSLLTPDSELNKVIDNLLGAFASLNESKEEKLNPDPELQKINEVHLYAVARLLEHKPSEELEKLYAKLYNEIITSIKPENNAAEV